MSSSDSSGSSNSQSPPIDLVYLWVDGADSKHTELRNKYNHLNKTDGCTRWQQLDEIYASIVSAHICAPWLHKIWIVVADYQTHLFDFKKLYALSDSIVWKEITVISHSTLFGDQYSFHLPVFNSEAIECHLHNIPGLSEHFIYANDDQFFGGGTPCQPNQFFELQSMRPIVQTNGMNLYNDKATEQWQIVRNNMVLLLGETTPPRQEIIHQMRPLTKSIMKCIWTHPDYKPWLELTSSHKFRQDNEIEPVGFALHYALDHQMAIKGSTHCALLISLTEHHTIEQIEQAFRARNYTMICINDNIRQPTKEFMSTLKQLIKERLPFLIKGRTDSETQIKECKEFHFH